MKLRPSTLLGTLLFGAASLWGCDRKADELPEWRPEDHDHQNEGSPSASGPGAASAASPAAPGAAKEAASGGAPRPPMAALERFGITPAVLASWKQNCVPCHGLIGAGDGPQGAVLRPRNLADPAWQRVALDDEIAHAIKKGRGRMPAFPGLPDETVTGLVRLVRLMNPERSAEPEPAPAEAPRAPDAR